MKSLIWLLLLLSGRGLLAQSYTPGWVEDAQGHRQVLIMRQNQLIENNQAVFIKESDGSNNRKMLPGQLLGFGVGEDTFAMVPIAGRPLFLKILARGPVTLATADEMALHTLLIEQTGISPFDPLATNASRVYDKAETDYDTPIAILLLEGGNYRLLNPNPARAAQASLKEALPDYPARLPDLPPGRQRLPMSWYVEALQTYNLYLKDKQAKAEAEYKAKEGF